MRGNMQFTLFSLFFLLMEIAVAVHPSTAGVSSYFWLKPGTQAVYTIPQSVMYLDDYGLANPVRGNYSWLCLEVNDSYAVLDVQVILEVYQLPEWTTPGSVDYFGSEFVEKAARGDLSFIKRIPMDQVVGRIEIYNDTGNPLIRIPSPIVLKQHFKVVVNLDTMMIVGDDGEPWGRWTLWIDPFKYSLGGWEQRTIEPFIMNWLNTTIEVEVYYLPSGAWVPLDTMFGVIKGYFYAGVEEAVDNPFLTEMGWTGGIVPTYYYEPRTGVFLLTRDYIDDVLIQKFGIIILHQFGKQADFHLSNVLFPGDLNSDWVSNIADISIVARAFGSRPGDVRWNQVADVNGDGVINIVDITIVAKAFGTQYIIPD
jgi:hypothetical protein